MTGRVLALVALMAGFAGAAAPAGAAGTGQSPYASLGGFICRPASNSLNRVVGVTSTMRPMPGTQTMKLRFVLLQRTPEHTFYPVKGGDLGRWRQAAPETWVVHKPVVGLPAPAVYKFRVSFVWLSSAGTAIGAQTLLSPACTQPG